MKKNIDIHLDYVYPLNHSRDGKASGWLFTSEKCPDDVEPFAFRYLHEHNLYNSKADNIDAIHKFSKSLKLHLDITCAPSKDHKIFKRCEQLVQRASRKWDAGGYGFLTRRNGGIRKTPVFEHAWMHHRKRWIEEIHFGDTAGLLEIPSQCPSPPTIPTQAPPIANNKRQADGVESTGDSRQRTEAGPSKRRSNESSATPKAHSAGPSMPPMPPAQAGFTQPSSNRSVTRAPEAIMVTPFPVELTPEPIQSATSGPSSIATASGLSQSTNHPNRFSDFIFDDLAGREPSASASVVSSGLAGSNYDAPYLVDSPPPLKTEPPSPGLDGVAAFAKLLSTQARSPSIMHSVSQCGSAAADGPAPEKPKLYFAIENSKGMPDTSTSQLVSGPTFRDSSLSDFFALVATRSRRAIDSLDEITLRYTWINQNAVVVNKDIGDEAWEDIKEDVVDFFRMSREDNSARRRFHIWVMAGDITKAAKSTSRDDI
ncbi:hypothetical protein DL95DRAFT_394784 [Leptodontidium sp. 2 PMI_412]|nr:hypothetical protein DL95DRAFT_394784 [Leptodontidium sp. 2 PMI_412]